MNHARVGRVWMPQPSAASSSPPPQSASQVRGCQNPGPGYLWQGETGHRETDRRSGKLLLYLNVHLGDTDGLAVTWFLFLVVQILKKLELILGWCYLCHATTGTVSVYSVSLSGY